MSRKLPLFCNNWNLSRTGRTAKEVTAAFGEDLKLKIIGLQNMPVSVRWVDLHTVRDFASERPAVVVHATSVSRPLSRG